jgi:hypothetical protein
VGKLSAFLGSCGLRLDRFLKADAMHSARGKRFPRTKLLGTIDKPFPVGELAKSAQIQAIELERNNRGIPTLTALLSGGVSDGRSASPRLERL